MEATLTSIVGLIAASGSFGGLILGVVVRTSHKLRIPFSGKLIEIGFVGDALVGAGASIGAFFLAAPLFNMNLGGEKTLDEWVKIASFGVLAGLAGIKLLTNTSHHLNERIGVLDDRLEQIARGEKVNELVRRAEYLAAANRLEHALATYGAALTINPRSEPALIGKAKVFGERSQWDQALNAVSRILEVNPSSKRAYYHRARYKNMAGKYTKEEILQDLRSAISLDPHYKNYAALHDPHFESLREDDDFRRIVE